MKEELDVGLQRISEGRNLISKKMAKQTFHRQPGKKQTDYEEVKNRQRVDGSRLARTRPHPGKALADLSLLVH